ncbi:CocE/NonD family hydrolase [Halomarina litorea]|uniref:CocE/NonD family hydrolase n=1 Tax=Halomarina litorea TaxID=2961595 RepID=UPI0020C26F01|nr:CocE/NonD family hydrolase [Halomarina sp. BCD28]
MSTRREFITYGLTAALGAGLFADRAAALEPEPEQGDVAFSTTEALEIESFDGTTIRASVFEPDVDGERPAVLMTHGWGGTRADRRPLAEYYASHGYVVLTYDSRGFGESGGEVGVDGPNEVGDARTLLTWLANRDSVATDGPDDPRVGMDGYSYGAGIQLMTAIVDDRLDALVPRWGWHDLRFSNDPNRVLKWAWFYGLYQSGIANGEPNDRFLRLSEQAVEAREAPEELRAFWQSRSPVGQLGAIDTPTLLISGWEDRLFTANEAFANLQGLRDTGTDARLVMYDYGHDFVDSGGPTETQTAYANDAALAWLDAHLKDGETGDDEGSGATAPDVPVASLYRSQADTFETYDALPGGETALPLGSGASGGSSQVRLTGGSGNQNASSGTATFDFRVDEAVDVVGTPRLWLSVTPTGGDPSPHLFGTLSHVTPDGEATILKDQVAATRVESAGLLAFDLVGVERRVPAGHTLRVTLAAADGSLVEDAVPFDDALYVDSESPAGVVVNHSPGAPSTLALPTLDGVELAEEEEREDDDDDEGDDGGDD